MIRVFVALAVSDLALLCAAGVLGLSAAEAGISAQHVGLGLFAGLLTVFVHVVVFTYLTVSGKMMTQAVLIGRLDPQPLQQIRLFKRRVSRCVSGSFVMLLVAVAPGAMIAAEPPYPGSLPMFHGLSAAAVILVNAWAFHYEYEQVAQNGALMTRVFDAYESARDVNAAADCAGGVNPAGAGAANSEPR